MRSVMGDACIGTLCNIKVTHAAGVIDQFFILNGNNFGDMKPYPYCIYSLPVIASRFETVNSNVSVLTSTNSRCRH